jgi:RNA polymerase sigma-70 factor, ECF subfamily
LQQTAMPVSMPADTQILELVQEGRHEAAFECLMDHYERRLYRLCFAILRNAAEAEDAAQESLLRIWKALPRFDGRAALSTWVYTIARNRCLTALSRRHIHLSLSEPDVAAAAEGAMAPAAEQSGPQRLLRELVEALPQHYRQPLTLYYYGEHSVSEVAAQLGVPQGTVKTNLFRARAALCAQLADLGIRDVSQWLEHTT